MSSHVVEMPAPNLSREQVQEGINQGLFRDFAPAKPSGFTIFVRLTSGESVEAVRAFINNPPSLVSIPHGLKSLADAYLTIKSCYEAIPEPPMSGGDPWEVMRADYLARLHAAESALHAAGGPM